MKKTLFLMAGLCLLASPAAAQAPPHPVIENLKVIYKPVKEAVPSGTLAITPGIKVKGTAVISLKEGFDAAKIVIRILERQSKAVVYQVTYVINAPEVREQGLLLYKKEGNVVSITNPGTVSLKPYVYEVYTEDEGATKSSVYSIIQ